MSIDKRTYRTISLQEAIERFLKITELDKKAKINILLNSWEKVVGTPIAKRTLKVSYKNKTLYIKLKTGLDAMELLYLKKALNIRVKKFIGDSGIVEKIKII